MQNKIALHKLNAVETAVLGTSTVTETMTATQAAAIIRDAQARPAAAERARYTHSLETQRRVRDEQRAERQRAVNARHGVWGDTRFTVEPGARQWRAAYGGASGIVSARDLYPRAWFVPYTVFSACGEFYRAKTERQAAAALMNAIRRDERLLKVWGGAARHRFNGGRVEFGHEIRARAVHLAAAERVLEHLRAQIVARGQQPEGARASVPEGVSAELPMVRVFQERDTRNRPLPFAHLEIDGAFERVRLFGLEPHGVAGDDEGEAFADEARPQQQRQQPAREPEGEIRTGAVYRLAQRPSVRPLGRWETRRLTLELGGVSVRVYGVATPQGERWFYSPRASFEHIAATVARVLAEERKRRG